MRYPKWVTDTQPKDKTFPKMVGTFCGAIYVAKTGQEARKGLFWEMVTMGIGLLAMIIAVGYQLR